MIGSAPYRNASLAFSFALIPTSSDGYVYHLYVKDPARKNQSVLFTHGVHLCIQGFLYTFLLATIFAASVAGVRVKFYFRGSNLFKKGFSTHSPVYILQ